MGLGFRSGWEAEEVLARASAKMLVSSESTEIRASGT